MRELNSLPVLSFLCLGALYLISPPALAEESAAKNTPPSQVYQARINWKISSQESLDEQYQDQDFTMIPQGETPPADALKALESASKAAPEKEKFEDKLLSMLPYKNTLKHTWNVIDGDVDLLTVEGLRFDRGNRGIAYTTSFIPMIGDVDGFEMEFCAGKDMEINFKSDVTPFIGKLEGLSFRGKAGEDSAISFRYTVKLP
ncbi:MAG: hypothetical protein GW903_09050 [Alphaproteobacteria bacterium]|nr:hypothetical protein [Alphaproteobacteria bacterium]NCQ89105.1 hypothetical protein [Alphaproteobacteria bacterium]NCT08005.1 hypothetical protein [Alphaproteobacteria bacterium]